jgi:hypothetical protein
MTLLARGRYRYERDGGPTGISEPWQLERLESGCRLRGQRLIDGQPLLEVEAHFQSGRCTEMRLQWQPSGEGVPRVLRYRHRETVLEWCEEGGCMPQFLQLPADCLMFPLLRAAAGPLVEQLARASRWVVLPSLHDPQDTATFLRPLLSQRRAERVDSGPAALRHYRYFGGEYGEAGSDYWLDAHGILQRYRWLSPHGAWEVRNESGAAAAGFAGFC